MKNLVVLSLFLLSFFSHANAQADKDMNKKELHDLLEDRKLKIDTYSLSLETRSGIFGNKTKNDIKRSNEVLIDIVKTDNRIISTLYRVVDFRNYEKVNMSYDAQKKDEALNNLRHATDTLAKQLEVLKNTNHALHSKSLRLQWLVYALSFLILWMIISRWRKKRTKPDASASV